MPADQIQLIEGNVRRHLAELAPVGLDIRVRVTERYPETENLHGSYYVDLWTGEGRYQHAVGFAVSSLMGPEGWADEYLRNSIQAALRDLRLYREPSTQMVHGMNGPIGVSRGQGYQYVGPGEMSLLSPEPEPVRPSEWSRMVALAGLSSPDPIPGAYLGIKFTLPSLPSLADLVTLNATLPVVRVSRFERILSEADAA